MRASRNSKYSKGYWAKVPVTVGTQTGNAYVRVFSTHGLKDFYRKIETHIVTVIRINDASWLPKGQTELRLGFKPKGFNHGR
jgi:hypothetical protein